MDFKCQSCKNIFKNAHDGSLYFDQDTNARFFVCHDCLIVAARPRRWMMKAHIQLKTRETAGGNDR